MIRDIFYYPYQLYAEFEDGYQMCARGVTERGAMKKLIDVQNTGKHGELKFYTKVNTGDCVFRKHSPEEGRL